MPATSAAGTRLEGELALRPRWRGTGGARHRTEQAGSAGHANGSVPFMRKQYHLWPADSGFDAWDADRLIRLSRGLPVYTVAVDSIREVDTVYWFDASTTAPTVRAVVSTPG
jgi:hypothetical protein